MALSVSRGPVLVILASLYLPLISSALKFSNYTFVALFFKLSVMGLTYMSWAGCLWHERTFGRVGFILALLIGYGIWLNGWLIGVVSFTVGAFVFLVLCYPLLNTQFSAADERLFVRNAILALVLLGVFNLYFGPFYRFVHPYSNPNTIGFMIVGVMLVAGYNSSHDWEFKFCAVLSLAILFMVESRSSLVCINFLFGALLLRARQERKEVTLFSALIFLSIVLTVLVFDARGNFVSDQFSSEGRASVIIGALQAEHKMLDVLLGNGFGVSTNAFFNLQRNVVAPLGIDVLLFDSSGSLDNTLLSAFKNGGLLLVSVVLLTCYGWMYRAIAGWFAWIEACALGVIMFIAMLSMNILEAWPAVLLLLFGLWRWRPTENSFSVERRLRIGK